MNNSSLLEHTDIENERENEIPPEPIIPPNIKKTNDIIKLN